MVKDAKLIYEEVRKDLPLGSWNTNDDDDSFDRALFLRVMIDHITPELYKQSDSCTSKEAAILDQMVTAFLAQAIQCGSCFEHAASVFVSALEFKIPESKELVRIDGNQALKPYVRGYRKDNGEPIQEQFGSHAVPIFGRDKSSNLEYISTWDGITVIDTWGEGQILEYKKGTSPKDVDLVYGFFKPQSALSLVRVDQNLQADQWKKYAVLLTHIKNYINDHFEKWFETADGIANKVQKEYWLKYIVKYRNRFTGELPRINAIFDAKIEKYKNFGKENNVSLKAGIFKQPDTRAVHATVQQRPTTRHCPIM